MQNDILGFFGEYRWLSNFHQAVVIIEMDHEWPFSFQTTEAAYQASKSLDPKMWQKFSELQTGREAKFLGRKLEHIRPDWDLVKYDIMLKVTREKFKHEYLKQALLATGDSYLEETNTWGDTYWGVCNSIGMNVLGQIIMQVRNEIRQKRV